MKVAMMAAGAGTRLSMGQDAPPKALLEFHGQTLLQRHLDLLAGFGLSDITIVVGHKAWAIEDELWRIGAGHRVRTLFNPDYRHSSLLSLWALREVLSAGQPVLYMDADVLYDARLLERLLSAPHASCLLVDRDLEPGEEPLKVCVRDGRVVDFHKRLRATAYDHCAEWVGFARFSAGAARRLVAASRSYVLAGRFDAIYEEPMRDVILSDFEEFGLADITGLPWIEIDFPTDLERARTDILPRLETSRLETSRLETSRPEISRHADDAHRSALGPASRPPRRTVAGRGGDHAQRRHQR